MPQEAFDYRLDQSITAPLRGGLGQIVPSDSVNLAQPTRQLRVTVAGNLSVLWVDGSTTVEPVSVNDVLDWRIQRLNATGTTATVRGYV